MIEVCRERLNYRVIGDLSGRMPIAIIIAGQGFCECYIHDVQEKSLVVEDLNGQAHSIEIKDIISMLFLDYKDLFEQKKKQREESKILGEIFEKMNKHVDDVLNK